MHANVVVAIGSDETLPTILTHIHGAGLGHNAYLLRPRRTSIERQLSRSGIPTAQMPPRIDQADAALVVHAAARAGLAADITRQHGASATWIVSPSGIWTLIDDDVAVETPAAMPSASLSTLPTGALPESAAPDEAAGI